MEESYSDPIWEKALEVISQQVNEGTFNIWFAQTAGLGLNDGLYSVGVSSDFAKDWIDSRFRTLISDAVDPGRGRTGRLRDRGGARTSTTGCRSTAAPGARRRRACGWRRADSTAAALGRRRGPPGGSPRRMPAPSVQAAAGAVPGDQPGRGGRPGQQVHVRHLRRRPVQPVRPRRRPGRGRDARHPVQPALHLRRRRAWARPTCSRRSATTSCATIPGSRSATSPSRRSPTSSSTRCATTASRASRTGTAPSTCC